MGVEQGINMEPTNALSHKDKVDTDDDDWEITLLKGDNWDHRIWALNSVLAQKITLSSPSDPVVTKALTAMNNEKGEPWIPQMAKTDWEFTDGALYFKKHLYIPKPAHYDLVKSLHESLTRRHEGFFCTLHQMQQDYWWPGMSTFLQWFISGCTNCQGTKTNMHLTIPSLSPLAVKSPLPFFSISVDFITGSPNSHSFDSVMVIVDHGLTKGVIYCPCTKNIDVAGVAQLFFTHVFPQFSLHLKVISDRGPQFASTFAWDLPASSNIMYPCPLLTTLKPMEKWNE